MEKNKKARTSSQIFMPKSLYVAFDTFPAPKGAAVHIREFAGALFDFFKSGLLLVLGNEELPAWQIEDGFEIRRMMSEENNFLKKTIEFYDFVRFHAEAVKESIKVAHFRDPWGGCAILDVKDRKFKTVFEVNALPSIELPARYAGVSARTLEKIRNLELRCLEEADSLICPSQSIKNFLVGLGCCADKIQVILNGADIPENAFPRPEDAPAKYLIYFGAVQSWQGLEVLFKAMQFLRDFSDLYLVLCVSGTKPRLKYLKKLAERMEIAEKIIWNIRLNQQELQPWLANATISVAPLVECSRNLVQGCCPLKIVESMAHQIPVVASDIPVVRELIEHGHEGWLVRPDRPSELARGVRVLLSHPEKALEIGRNAQAKVKRELSWQLSLKKLKKVYGELG